MKKVLLLIVFALALGFIQPAHAAIPGLRVGFNDGDCRRRPDDDLSTTAARGHLIGALVELPIAQSRIFRARFELTYIEKSWTETGNADYFGYSVPYEAELNTSETVLAGLLMVRMGTTPAHPYALLGLDMGFPNAAEGKARLLQGSGSARISDDIPDWSDNDPGWEIGIGIVLPVGKSEFLFEIRQNFSLNNMYEGDEELFGSALEAKPVGTQVSCILQFGRPTG